MKRILVIEDQKDISHNIKEYLELQDIMVTQAFDGEDGLNKALSFPYDLILLDIWLPKINGFVIAEKVIQKTETPIIFLTAREYLEDKIFWLKLWSKDYIIKPFDLRELYLRVNIHLESKKQAQDINIFSKWEVMLDFKKWVFQVAGIDIKVPLKEQDILKVLIKNTGNLIHRWEIIEQVWGENSLYDSDGKLDVYISNLRKKLGKDFIETYKWQGYKI